MRPVLQNYIRRNERSRKSRRGFTFTEVMFCMIIFLIMMMVFAAVFPFAVKASRFSSNYAQASMIAQHKIDQLRRQSWTSLNLTTSGTNTVNSLETSLTNAGLVDSGSCSSNAVSGNYTVTCGFTNVDNIADNGSNVGYFPSGSTAKVSITPDTAAGVPSNCVFNIVIDVNWSGGGLSSGSYTALAKVVEMTHT